MLSFNVEKFVRKHVIKRKDSMFLQDIEKYRGSLSNELTGKKVLVIGGAGTIGSSYIKAILPFKPGKLVVVDYSENGLTDTE